MSKRILIAEDDDALREFYASRLETKLDCEVIQARSGREAVNALKENPSFSIVVSDYRMLDGNGDMVYSFLREYLPDVPFILSTGSAEEARVIPIFRNFEADHPKNRLLSKPYSMKGFLELVGQLAELSDRGPASYQRIRSSLFLLSNQAISDVFLRLSDEKYVCIAKTGDSYANDVISKYTEKGADHFYVRSMDYKKYCDYLFDHIVTRIKEKDVPSDQRVSLEVGMAEMVREHIRQVGITDKVMQAIDDCMESVIQTLRGDADIFTMIEQVQHGQGYLSKHSIATAYVAGSVAHELGWWTDSTFKKLGIAAILHDCLLDDTLAEYVDIFPSMEETLSPQDWERLLQHPKKTAEMIRQARTIYPDIDDIVLYHHERPNGTGYPSHLPPGKIPSLACLFIMAEDLAHVMCQQQLPLSVSRRSELANDFIRRYKVGNFIPALDGLVLLLRGRNR